MDREKALDFIIKHKQSKLYQPVIFLPGILEIRGKWHQETIDLAKNILHDANNKTCLDLGCCQGFFLQEAKKQGALNCTGIDNDIISTCYAKEINKIMELDIEIMNGNIEDYFPVEQYDIVLLLNVLHLISDKEKMMNHCLAMTRGRLVIECDIVLLNFIENYTKNIYNSPRSVNRIIATIQLK